ncbi:MAG TPA: HEXXH motif-containing putative peptide modification protein [Polyangium sp.]|nr:HEXXH motif-containing putative peptide modification protein [Polyangium sp.]
MPPVRPALNPHDLTIPEPGSTTARTVLTGALAQLLRDLPTIGRSFPASPALLHDLHQFQVLRQELNTKQRGALPSFLARTPIGTLVRCLRHQPSEALLRELLALVYFELARVGALEGPIRQKCPPKRILSLAGRISITLPNEAQALLYKPGKVVVELESGQVELDLDTYDDKPAGYSESVGGVIVEKPYHLVDKNIVLALADNNPLAMFDAHPDKQGNAIDLGGKTAAEWTNVLQDGLQLIAAMLPDLRTEMDLFVQQIVPVGFDEQKHLSASYQEAIGTIYMSLHPSLMTMTEALIHEFSHNKINALFELDGVLENAFSPLYTSPVRPDPRPLHGVLLAVHAFLPVARLYEKMVESGHPLAQNSAFLGRFAKIRQINAEGAQVVLEHGRPTPVGKPLLDEIRRWDGYYEGFA